MKPNPHLLKTFLLYIVLPVILLAVPVSVLDSFPSICLFKNVLGRECPGCGMTRAFVSALHFRFTEAFCYNRLIVIVFPLGIFLFFHSFLKNIRDTLI